ncbi:MAG: class I SAM-dependent methyltransferase [Candidatus Atabeyarchaeum deiterrae]
MVDPDPSPKTYISFERIAPVYDATRRMADEVCIEISREICAEAGDKEGMLVADMGAGTGRFSIPLAIRGCRVIGVDISREMLHVLLSKIRPDWRSRVQPVLADAQNPPFKSSCFDVTLCFQVMHLIQGWHSLISEAQRILVDCGLLAVGESIRKGISADINNEYKEIRARHGYSYTRVGAENIEEVLDYLRSKEYDAPEEPEKHTWVGRMTISSIIRGLADKVYSGTWSVPDEAHREIIQELRDWASKTFNSLEISREIASEFKIAFARFPRSN